MRKLNLLAAFLMMFALISCSSDDDNSAASGSGEMSYNGQTVPLKSGGMINYGDDWGNGTNFDLELYSSELSSIDIGDVNFVDDEISAVYFELFTANENDLETGVYTYSESWNGDPGTFESSDFYLNCTAESDGEDCELEMEINGGTLEVISNGDNYSIEFDVTLSNGENLTGSYNGSVHKFDADAAWGRPADASERNKMKFLK
ncbi:MAG: hypothetical protein ACQESK_09395 [Bacteroidota bacterium]